MEKNKTYIGDGVYAEIDDYGAIVLTTENGFEVTNRIVIELREWLTLINWINKKAESSSVEI